MATAAQGLIGAVAAALAVVAGLSWTGEVPAWRPGGSQILGHPLLAPVGSFPIAVPRGATVLVRGDSNATNHRIGGSTDWPRQLGQRLGAKITLINQSAGGLTAHQGAMRWTIPEATRLCILAYGTNDAGPRGWLSDATPVGLSSFSKMLANTIQQCQARQAQVIVLAALPVGGAAIERRVAPYRAAARDAALRTGAAFLDPIEAFEAPEPDQSLLQYDALHLTAAGHERLAAWLARQIVRSDAEVDPH